MSLEEHYEVVRPGDLSEAKHLSADIENQLGNAQALVERGRQEAKKYIALDYPQDAELLEGAIRDLDAAAVDVRKHLQDVSPQEHLSLALRELNHSYHELLEILESTGEHPEPKKISRPPNATLQ